MCTGQPIQFPHVYWSANPVSACILVSQSSFTMFCVGQSSPNCLTVDHSHYVFSCGLCLLILVFQSLKDTGSYQTNENVSIPYVTPLCRWYDVDVDDAMSWLDDSCDINSTMAHLEMGRSVDPCAVLSTLVLIFIVLRLKVFLGDIKKFIKSIFNYFSYWDANFAIYIGQSHCETRFFSRWVNILYWNIYREITIGFWKNVVCYSCKIEIDKFLVFFSNWKNVILRSFFRFYFNVFVDRLISGNTHSYSRKVQAVVRFFTPRPDLRDLFKVELHMKLLYGHKGALANQQERWAKFSQILNILSQRAESHDDGTEF